MAKLIPQSLCEHDAIDLNQINNSSHKQNINAYVLIILMI